MAAKKRNIGPFLNKKVEPQKITPEKREEMIRVAAYYRAEKKKFAGNPGDFWCEAERELEMGK